MRFSEPAKKHQLMVIARHHRRIAAGILSVGPGYRPARTLPYPVQSRLSGAAPEGPPTISGKAKLEAVRDELEAGRHPFRNIMVGMKLRGKTITDYAHRFLSWSPGPQGGESDRLRHLALVLAVSSA